MIRAGVLGLGALALASAAAAAEGGPIRGGEHDGFTRIVLTIEPTTEWSLESGEGRAVIHFPGRQLAFATGQVFDKIPRSRIVAVTSAPDASGTTVTVDLGCDCRVSTSFVGARYLALDVADRSAEVATEAPEARAAREAKVVAGAEQALIRQIERAASQGVVELSAPDALPKTTAPEDTAPRPRAVEPAPPAPTPAEKLAPVSVPTAPDATTELFEAQEQIEATTVFDRDGRRAVEARTTAAPASACLDDARLDLGAWSNGLDFTGQAMALRRQLVGEFDAPNAASIVALARLYIRFGFGTEAQALLDGFAGAPDVEDRALLADLARAVDGRPAAPGGPLAYPGACPGLHGLWLALGGMAPVFHDPASFASVQSAFAALPPDLRLLVGPGFAGRLLDAGRPAEARLIYDTTVRPGTPSDAAVQLVAARLAAAEGRPEEAAAALTALLDGDGHASVDTLAQLARVALDARLPIPERFVTDLRAAALQYRGGDRERQLRGLLVEALARRAELAAAIREARAAARDMPDAAAGFEALAVGALAEADPAAVGAASYSETVLGATDLIDATAPGDPARAAVAGRLVALGLPGPALAMVSPALVAGDEAARLTAAEARLSLGDPAAARDALGPLAAPEAVELRARSFALEGAYDRALSTLADRGLASDAAAYAWPSGAWSRVRDAAPDPGREAMAGYMTVRSGEAAPPAPAADPAALDSNQAFQEPLPPLERPSLDAARRLLSTGGQVGGFVQNLLTDAPADTAAPH